MQRQLGPVIFEDLFSQHPNSETLLIGRLLNSCPKYITQYKDNILIEEPAELYGLRKDSGFYYDPENFGYKPIKNGYGQLKDYDLYYCLVSLSRLGNGWDEIVMHGYYISKLNCSSWAEHSLKVEVLGGHHFYFTWSDYLLRPNVSSVNRNFNLKINEFKAQEDGKPMFFELEKLINYTLPSFNW